MRFFSLLPRKADFKTEMDHFNNSMDQEFRTVRDFLILHYKATERDDSELWNYCRNMPIPDTLQDKLDLYKSGSWLERNNQELFGADSWLAVLNGQHIKARSYSPLVDSIPNKKLERLLSDTRVVIEQCATAMPDHEDFIKENCFSSTPTHGN
jgi:tryptophan halogenase